MQNVKSICVIFLLFKIKYRFTNRSCVETPVATLVFANGKFKSDIKFLFHPVYISKQMYVELKLWHFTLFRYHKIKIFRDEYDICRNKFVVF